MTSTLSSRQVRIVEWLLDRDQPSSVSAVAGAVRLSPRMVRSDLPAVERFLKGFGVSIERRRGLGIWLEGQVQQVDAARAAIAAIDPENAVRVSSQLDRLHQTLFRLLAASPEPITVVELGGSLLVSTSSARRDITRAEEWLHRHDLYLARQPGVGMSVIGSEAVVRRGLVKLLLEAVPANVVFTAPVGADWWRIPSAGAGIRDFLRLFPLDLSSAVLSGSDAEGGHDTVAYRWLAADLAVALFRVSVGHRLDLEPGSLRSLRDHPVWETAEALSAELTAASGVEFDDNEVGGVAERLLGVAELAGSLGPAARGEDMLAVEALEVAAQLHPGLSDDRELLESLTDHISRLRVRLRHGLPVHNPLLREVSARYPDVHQVAVSIADLLARELDAPLSDDEAGFITMYLSGSLERLRLRPRSRAVIVCPTGIASAWILVSRVQAEFPELDLVEVLSAASIDEAVLDADIVISTVEIGETIGGVPVLVVSPLLPADDVRRVAQVV